jgi:hypothetical protein
MAFVGVASRSGPAGPLDLMGITVVFARCSIAVVEGFQDVGAATYRGLMVYYPLCLGFRRQMMSLQRAGVVCGSIQQQC